MDVTIDFTAGQSRIATLSLHIRVCCSHLNVRLRPRHGEAIVGYVDRQTVTVEESLRLALVIFSARLRISNL